MKRILTAALVLGTTSLAAQTPEPIPVEPSTPKIQQVSLSRFSGYRSPSAFSPIFSYGRYGIDGDFTSALIFGLAFLFFKVQNTVMKGGIRPSAEDELEGMDLPEMGVLAYPEFAMAEVEKISV